MRNEIFIEFGYNGREIEGIDDFKKELSKHYLCQGKDVSIPSFSEGGETWFTVFINSEFFEFAKNAVIGGLAWDLLKTGTKNYFLKPLFEALKKLEDTNKDSYKLKIEEMKFQFDDIDIVFGGLRVSSIATVGLVFNEIAKRRAKIERQIEMPISKIITPIFHNPSIDKKGYSPYILETHPESIESYIEMWKIGYIGNREWTIYKLETEEYLEAYPN
jgi:hypothetical protein